MKGNLSSKVINVSSNKIGTTGIDHSDYNLKGLRNI